MRILLANSTCKVGGVSTFLLALRRELVRQGHVCHLFFFEHGTMDPHLPSEAQPRFGTLADCLQLVARERIQVVHANNVDWPTGISAVRQLGARLVVTAHKVRVNGPYGWTRATCDAMTAVAQWIADALQPQTDLPVVTIRNGVDLDRFHPDRHPSSLPGAPIVLWVGRAGSEHKRLDRFAAAAPSLAAAGYRLWVVDQHGPERLEALYGTTPARTLAALAERWAPVPFEQMPDLYRQVAASGGCLVSTSQSEGLPLTLLEAQACGCPVIASDVRGNREATGTDAGGMLYPETLDGARLATLVAVELSGRAALEARGRLAAQFVRQHGGLETMARQFERLYASLEGPAPLDWARRLVAPARLGHAAYLETRWGTGAAQLAASERLAATAHWRLAAAAAREAATTAPTLFLRPGRAAHLVRVHLRR